MALPASFLAGATFQDALDSTALDLDLTSATAGDFRCSLWRNTWTGTFDPETTTDPAGTGIWVSTNEYDATGYSTNDTEGYLSTPTLTSAAATRKLVWDDNDATKVWTGLSGGTAGPYGVLITEFVLARPIVFINFGAEFGLSAGTFQITWDPTDGIFNWSY